MGVRILIGDALAKSDGRFKKGERRSPATEFKPGQHWRPPQAFRDREWLEAEYVAKGRSTGDIAAQFGVVDGAVIFWMQKHGIPRRSVSEARKLKHWGLIGEANPMYGKRGPASPTYIDGSAPERQTLYARSEWRQVVKAVYARDEYRCQRCASAHTRSRSLHAHHIKPWAGNPDLRSELSNLVTLCTPAIAGFTARPIRSGRF